MSRALFLCTGNYYRSRFAGVLFNELARRRQLNWQAESRGIATGLGVNNVGPISVHAVKGLQKHGIIVDSDVRNPLPLEEQDLLRADRIVALDEQEHRPLLRVTFPAWENKVEYWHVHDLHKTPADEALTALGYEICTLIDRLAQSGKP